MFEVAAGSGAITTLASFNGANGQSPQGNLVESGGNLYGTAGLGGADSDGTVFEYQMVAPGTFTVTNTADSGANSLRQAILNSNATPGSNTIAFSIPGSGVQTITLLSALPAITNSVLIDGWSQGGSGYTGAPLVEIYGA